MNRTLWRCLVVLAVIGTVMIGLKTRTLAQEESPVSITSPAEGQIVSGLITVTGTVNFPDFLKYEIFLKSGQNLAWVATSYAPVINGNLARLDSRVFLDGTYQMVVRQVHPDSNYTDYPGPTITLQNGLSSPFPEPEIESSYLYTPVSGALMRIKNCGGLNLEFDYTGVEGACAADDLWIMAKLEDSPICPYVDVLVPPCEYRGTAVGEGEERGATYSLVVEAGKVYQFDYAGNAKLFLGEVQGDERAETDTGGLAPGAPDQAQPAPVTPGTGKAPGGPTTKAGVVLEAEPAVVAAPATGNNSPNTLLPVSGEGRVSNLLFIGVAGALILLLIVGGLVAARKRSYTP